MQEDKIILNSILDALETIYDLIKFGNNKFDLKELKYHIDKLKSQLSNNES